MGNCFLEKNCVIPFLFPSYAYHLEIPESWWVEDWILLNSVEFVAFFNARLRTEREQNKSEWKKHRTRQTTPNNRRGTGGGRRLLRGEISHLLFDIRNEIVSILHCGRRIIDNIFIEVAEEGAEELVDGLQELLEDGMDLELNIEGNRRRVWKTSEKRGKSKKGREKYIVMRLSRMQLSISSVFWFEEVWRAASNRNWM